MPMGINPAPIWAYRYLNNDESKYITDLIGTDKLRGRQFHFYFRFIDLLCALNDSGKFDKPFLEIYPTELELKVEHNSSHATLLDLGISIDKGKFIYKMFGKRDTFNFQIFRIPSITIPSIIFYSSLSDFVRIARSTLLHKDFLPVANY